MEESLRKKLWRNVYNGTTYVIFPNNFKYIESVKFVQAISIDEKNGKIGDPVFIRMDSLEKVENEHKN